MKNGTFDKIDTILVTGLILMTIVALLLAIVNLVTTNEKETVKSKEITTITSRIIVSFYPEPICESCGKPLDGTHEKCVPEGE